MSKLVMNGKLDLRNMVIESEPQLCNWIKQQAILNTRKIPQQVIHMLKQNMKQQIELEEKMRNGTC